MEHQLHRRQGAVEILDEYVRRTQAMVEKEIWAEFVHALHTLAPESKYAEKDEQDDPLLNKTKQ